MTMQANNRNQFGFKDCSNCYLNINGIHYIQWSDFEEDFNGYIKEFKAKGIKYIIRTINNEFKRLYREDYL